MAVFKTINYYTFRNRHGFSYENQAHCGTDIFYGYAEYLFNSFNASRGIAVFAVIVLAQSIVL